MDPTDLAYAGAARQAALIRSGEVSAREVVEATLDRIAAVDPVLNAYRTVLAERALVEADQADARRKAGDTRPLLGVPVAVKDDTDVAGETTAWGSAALDGRKTHDAEVVRRLRAAGAVVVGKAMVPELTLLPATDTVTFGAARNPWDLGRTPGGSSGGPAAAVAAGLCGVALGSDGAGSIRLPASWTGVFGLKTTRGLVPLAPHDDAWQGLAVYGALARSVADAALFLDAVTGETRFTEAAARRPERLRVAVTFKAPPGTVARLGREERRAVDETAQLLRDLGHEVVERDLRYDPTTTPAGFVRALRGLADDVGDAVTDRALLEPRTRRLAAVGGALPAAAVRWARDAEARQAARILELWDDADVVLLPSVTDGPYRAGQVGRWGAATWLARAPERLPYLAAFNLTGQPACSVPAGFDDDGLPLGVQLAGRPGDDATLLSLAAHLEEHRPWADRRPPLS